LSYLESLPNVSQDASEYNNCLQQCFNLNSINRAEGRAICFNNCLSYVSSNPIAISIVASGVSDMNQLIPISISNNGLTGYAIYICHGSIKSFAIQVNNVSLSATGSTQVTLTLDISIPAVDSNYNALEITLVTGNAGYYGLGLYTFQTTTSPSGASFRFTVTLSES
jgi:hypothetical protein